MAGGGARGTMRNAVGINATGIRHIIMFLNVLKRIRIGGWLGCGLLLRRIGQGLSRPRGPPAPSVPLPAVRWRVFP